MVSHYPEKIQNDPKIIEHLVKQAGELVMNLIPPEPPPRPSVTTTECPAIVSKLNTNVNTIVTPSTSVDFSSSLPSRAHRRTLEFITEAAQELYAKGQLRIKPYARKCIPPKVTFKPLTFLHHAHL